MINVKTDTTDTATEGHTIYYLNTNTTTTYGTSFNSTPKLRISAPVPGYHGQLAIIYNFKASAQILLQFRPVFKP
jgi:hypothetical protein